MKHEGRARRLTALCVVTVAVAGCSVGDLTIVRAATGEGAHDAGGGASPSLGGLAWSAVLGSLGDADFTRLCDGATGAYDASQRDTGWGCKLSGVFAARSLPNSGAAPTDADVQNACIQGQADCETASQTVPASPPCTKPASTCHATVSEYAACLADNLAVFENGAASLPPCASLTVRDLDPSNAPSTALPASCTTFRARCPGGDILNVFRP